MGQSIHQTVKLCAKEGTRLIGEPQLHLETLAVPQAVTAVIQLHIRR